MLYDLVVQFVALIGSSFVGVLTTIFSYCVLENTALNKYVSDYQTPLIVFVKYIADFRINWYYHRKAVYAHLRYVGQFHSHVLLA